MRGTENIQWLEIVSPILETRCGRGRNQGALAQKKGAGSTMKWVGGMIREVDVM